MFVLFCCEFSSIASELNKSVCVRVILGEKVFEWDQTLDEVNIYINLPPNVHSKQFYCKIQSKHLELGIKGNPPYLNVSIIFLLFISFLNFFVAFILFYFIFPLFICVLFLSMISLAQWRQILLFGP